MREPIFILGCHRSGTSAVAGLLMKACGVSMGDLMPPTEDNPLGYFEAIGVVDAHRNLLAQMERDWTCPPSSFEPEALDLSVLEEEIAAHRNLPGPWAMKDPRSMFLLPAWSSLGIDRVRLIAVARPPVDTIQSIVNRDGIREDRAEAIVDAYLRRLVEIAQQTQLPVITFPGHDESVIDQVRFLADSLNLPWDEGAAHRFFHNGLVRHRSELKDSSPTYDLLLSEAQRLDHVPPTMIGDLKLGSEPQWALETHLGPRHGAQQNELWSLAKFDTFPSPEVVEIRLNGARCGGKGRSAIHLHQMEVENPGAAAAILLDRGIRPHGVVAHQMLSGLDLSDLKYFFRSMHLSTHPLAELVADVPDPLGDVLATTRPTLTSHPSPEMVQRIASECGWEAIASGRVSIGRTGLVFRKQISTSSELTPVIADLISRAHELKDLEARVRRIEESQIRAQEGAYAAEAERRPMSDSTVALGRRADAAERELHRLRNRRSVRFALAVAQVLKPVFRMVRSWRR